MAIFTAIATALFAGTALAGTFAVTATAFGLQVAAGLGLNYAAQAIAGKPQNQVSHFSAQGQLQGGGDVPRSFAIGISNTAGSLVYANTWSPSGAHTPNAYIVQVRAISDLPCQGLLELWVNGELCTVNTDPARESGFGFAVDEYRKNNTDYLWCRFYDGNQTEADPFLVSIFGADPVRPYQATRIGRGVAFAVVAALVEDTLFTGFPDLRFTVRGPKLYDISKDSSSGGSGTHRYDDPSTWGGDGDDLMAVQAYNVSRGLSFNGQWLYGLQNLPGPRLPAANWIAQVNNCREAVAGPDDTTEPQYRTGGQVVVSTPIVETLTALMTAGQGRMWESGGFFKMKCGAPGSADFSFTDDEIIVDDEQTFSPFLGLADTVNGISGTYPSPQDGWNAKVALLYDATLEAQDGNRRLPADVTFNFCYSASQVQRVMKSAVQEARRARRETVTVPPKRWAVEPGDIGAWTSAKRGYDAKLFRVDGVLDRAKLCNTLDMTEVDPADYDWHPDVDYIPPVIGSTMMLRPAPQPVTDWDAQPDVIVDEDGISRRPAIRLTWDATVLSVSGVKFQIRYADTHEIVYQGNTLNVSAGAIRVSANLLPDTAYQAQGEYIPAWPRDMLPSDWINVTTDDIRLDLAEFTAGMQYQLTDALDRFESTANQLLAYANSVTRPDLARNWIDKVNQRREISSVTGKVRARIEEVWTAATSQFEFIAQTQLTLEGEIGDARSSIQITNTVLGDLSQSVADQTQDFNTRFGQVTASVTTEIQARSAADGALATSIANFSAQTGQNFASVNQTIVAQSNSIGSIAGSLNTVITTVGNHTASLTALQSSVDGSSVQAGFIGSIDGVTGSFIFQGVRVNGTVNFGLIIDGYVTVLKNIDGASIRTGTLDVLGSLHAGSIYTDLLQIGSVTNLGTFTYGAKNWQSTSPITIVSGAWDILSGTATIEWSDNIYIDGSINVNPVPSVVTFHINVNGVNRRTVSFRPYGTSAAWFRQDPMTAKTVVTGLAPGSYTFSITGDHGATAATILLDGGIMTVLDLKR